jgi:zinc protease
MRRFAWTLCIAVLIAAGCRTAPQVIAPVADAASPADAGAAPPATTAASLADVGAAPVCATLDNGVAVAVLEDPTSPVVSLRVYVRTGSMHEGKFLGAGVSHFLEHLVCGGSTAKRTEDESQKLLDSIGAQANAYTTRDHTCYYMTTASAFFDTALDLLSDWTTNAAITQEEWQREFEVVQREMETRRSNPGTILAEAGDQILFEIFPARVPVIGYRDAFRALTRDDVYGYYKKTYRPDNLLVVAAGGIDAQEAIEKIRAAFGGMQHLAAEPIILPQEPRQVAPRRIVKENPVGQAMMTVSWRTIPLTHPDLYPLDLLSFILSSGGSSRLVRVLRDERRLVNAVDSASYTPGYDGGEFTIYAALDPANLEAAEQAIMEQVRIARDTLVTDDELLKAKRQKIADHVFGLQTAEAKATTLGTDILSSYDPEFSRSYALRIQETGAEEIRDAARRYLTDDRVCVTIVKPPVVAAGEETAAETTAETPAVREVRLPNGLRLLLRRDPALPIVSISTYFLGGLRAEPEGKNGVSAFTAAMLTRGTPTRTAQQIAEAFDRMGGGISGGSGNNSIFLVASCLSEDLDEAMDIFADVARNASFPPDEVEKMQPRIIAAAESRLDDWHNELFDAFRKRWFGSHPYRNPSGGDPESLKALTRQDLIAFHAMNMVPDNGVMAIYGDIDPDRIEAAVRRLFGDQTGAPAAPPAPAAEAPPAEDETVRVTGKRDMGGVFIGYPGMTFADVKDRYATDVLDAVISGIAMPRGWLHETLRGKGLVYEVQGFNFVGMEPGYFGIYAGCEPGRVDEVKRIALEQVGRLFTETISDEEMKAARQSCVTANVMDRQTNSEQATGAALAELYGQGYAFPDQYEAGIQAVTAEDVRRVAEKYLTHYLCVLMTPETEKE